MAYKNLLLNNLGASSNTLNEQLQETSTFSDHIIPFSLNPTNEPVIEIDSDSRIINVPDGIKTIGIVAGDHLAETFYFHISRYFDERDLSKHQAIIRYINAGNEYGESKPVDITIEENDITLGWTLDNKVTRYAGEVSFTIQWETIENGVSKYQWQTLPAIINIKSGLDIEKTITDKDDLLFRTLSNQIQDLQEKYDSLINSNILTNIDNLLEKLNKLEMSVKYLEENVVYVSKE